VTLRKTAVGKVSIAVPTGALMPGALRLLARAGVARLSAEELGRQLIAVHVRQPEIQDDQVGGMLRGVQ